MAKKLTEKALVKKLESLRKEELMNIIVDFYKTNKSVEGRIESYDIRRGLWKYIVREIQEPIV